MKMPNMVVTTIAAIVIISVLGYYARDNARNGGRVGNNDIGLELGVPIEHKLTDYKGKGGGPSHGRHLLPKKETASKTW